MGKKGVRFFWLFDKVSVIELSLCIIITHVKRTGAEDIANKPRLDFFIFSG